MKPTLVIVFLFLSLLSARAQTATKQQWIDFVKKDAKVSVLEDKIGKPDSIMSDQGLTRYYWYGKVNAGTSSAESLVVIVAPLNGVNLVCALTDGSTLGEIYWFPWAHKVRSDF